MASVYEDTFDVVERAVASVLAGADRESVIHDVFARLVGDEDMRRRFAGGSLSAWLRVVARNAALDVLRKRRREELMPNEDIEALSPPAESVVERAEAKALLARFEADVLPEKWRAVFRLRFLRDLTQEEAAAALHLSRTTLAYQEARIRFRLKRFVLAGPHP